MAGTSLRRAWVCASLARRFSSLSRRLPTLKKREKSSFDIGLRDQTNGLETLQSTLLIPLYSTTHALCGRCELGAFLRFSVLFFG